MTVFDYLVVFVLTCSIIISMLRGLVREILSLASWIVALVVANTYAEALAAYLPEMLPELIRGNLTRLIVAFIALFIGTRIMMALLTMTLEALVRAGGLTVADRGLGGLFGLGRGLVIILAAVLLCGLTAIPQQAFWKDALLSPLAETAARTVKPFLPGDMARHVQF